MSVHDQGSTSVVLTGVGLARAIFTMEEKGIESPLFLAVDLTCTANVAQGMTSAVERLGQP